MTVRDAPGSLNIGEKAIYRLARCGASGLEVAAAWRFKLDDWMDMLKLAADQGVGGPQ